MPIGICSGLVFGISGFPQPQLPEVAGEETCASTVGTEAAVGFCCAEEALGCMAAEEAIGGHCCRAWLAGRTGGVGGWV